MKKGLLITFYFPPLNSVASHRTYSFAKYLNSSGRFKLDVACPSWEGSLDYNTSGINILELPVQPFDLNYGYQKPKGWRVLKEIVLNRMFRYNYFLSARKNRFYHDSVSALDALNLNDYDFFITSYGPLDSLHIGNYLKNKYPDKKWIIDFRDLYSEMEYYNFGVFRTWFRKWERKICTIADGFITVSETLRDIQEKLLGLKGYVVYNGYEPFEASDDPEFIRKINSLGKNIISYTGSLYNGERDVLPLLKFVEQNKLSDKLKLVFALISDQDEIYLKECLEKSNPGNVTILRNLNYNQSVILQNSSIALMMFANFGGRGNGYLTGKIFEYMCAGKPVIYSGTTGVEYELYNLIRKFNVGESFDSFNYEDLSVYTANNIDFFTRKNQALRLESCLEEIIK